MIVVGQKHKSVDNVYMYLFSVYSYYWDCLSNYEKLTKFTNLMWYKKLFSTVKLIKEIQS